MKEISLYILDITQNSISAKASNISLTLDTSGDSYSFTVVDDGCGMNKEMLETVKDPFTTSRTTRKFGLGIPFLNDAVTLTGGNLDINSEETKGTVLTANFIKNSIDCPPLGDIAQTISLIIQSIDDNLNFVYRRIANNGIFQFSTTEIKDILGNDISLKEPEILLWIQEYVKENESSIL